VTRSGRPWIFARSRSPTPSWIAFVSNGVPDRVVGIAEYSPSANRYSYECAVVVADDWRRRDVGRLLMALLVDTAAVRGLSRIGGAALAINRPMLALARVLGFDVSASNDTMVRCVGLNVDRRRASE